MVPRNIIFQWCTLICLWHISILCRMSMFLVFGTKICLHSSSFSTFHFLGFQFRFPFHQTVKICVNILISWHCWIKLIQSSITATSTLCMTTITTAPWHNEVGLWIEVPSLILENLLFVYFHVVMQFIAWYNDFWTIFCVKFMRWLINVGMRRWRF